MDVSTILGSSVASVSTSVITVALTAVTTTVAVAIDRKIFRSSQVTTEVHRPEAYGRNATPHDTFNRSIAEMRYTDGQGNVHMVPYPYELHLYQKSTRLQLPKGLDVQQAARAIRTLVGL
ncbi:hypothetical protein BU16DRAFT_561041 [Lophium mytilinum]|uniref:Uncharacterized protein n=1 Tax=Lophium mytilinum TaxID=390894 RepID=A0A6A6QYR3_9PEZI|nr:hypothetical protein BU16DRAFT_561041 [Lophium mytilinum]